MNSSQVAVVILNWNGQSFLQKFLPSVVQNTKAPGVEIIVADNGSTDQSVQFLKDNFPDIRVIEFEKNYGFSGGYNKALQQVKSNFFVLLNSDVEVPAGWLTPLIDFMNKNTNVAACMPKLLDYNHRNRFEYAGAAGGFIDSLGYPFCRGRILNAIEEDNGQYDKPVEVFWASGACMLIRSDIYWLAGGLDDDFFAHMEEIDLCWRIKNLGYTIWCNPTSMVFHVGGGTLPNNNPHKLYLNYRNSLYMLYKNLPSGMLWGKILIRLSLDWASAIVYLLTARFAFGSAVIRAHLSFWSNLSVLNRKRLKTSFDVRVVLSNSILISFFIKRRRKYSDLGIR